MKSIAEVLRQKEAELQSLQHEIEALRLAMRLCSEGEAERIAVPDNAPKPVRSVPGVPVTGDKVMKQFP